MQLRLTTSWFTLVEMLIGMTIFSVGLAGIYALLQTTMSTVRYSRDEIIVSGLLREQVDLVMNMRDSSIRNYIPFDSVYIDGSTQTWLVAWVYTIESNFAFTGIAVNGTDGVITGSPIKLKKIDPFPTSDADKWTKTALLTDSHGRYVHNGAWVSGTETQFATYMYVSPLGYTGSTGFVPVTKDGKNQWWIIDARVLVRANGSYREYDAKTIVSDWQE